MGSPLTLTEGLKAEAKRLGFGAIGIAPAVAPPGYEHYRRWLDAGHAAGMHYLHRQAEARSDPNRLLDGVRSIIVGSYSYNSPGEPPADPTSGKVARYARGVDYHELLWRKLEALLDWLGHHSPGIRGRAVADTAPLLERDYAQLAGLGWIGKNTMLIHRRLGSYTFLGSLLVDAELAYDPPHAINHCGTCTRCLEACPTDALVAPLKLDARRCISYWTIEHRGPIPEDVAETLDGWVFGCDICQEVCPWNRKAEPAADPELAPGAEWSHPDLIVWIQADPESFARSLKGSAMSRAKRKGLVRNAALILGQRRVVEAVPALILLLRDEDPGIRHASAWALGRIGGPEATEALRSAQDVFLVNEVSGKVV